MRKIACFSSRLINEYTVINGNGNTGTASPCGWPKFFFGYFFVFTIDLTGDDELHAFTIDHTGDGKLGFGFTSADDLEEVDIGPGDKPRLTFISK